MTTLFAATILGTPTPKADSEAFVTESGIRIFGRGDKGDGLYVVAVNETGEANIEFTALSELNLTNPSFTPSPIQKRANIEERKTLARRGTECTALNSGHLDQLDQANVQMARQADNRTWKKHQWLYVRYPHLKFLLQPCYRCKVLILRIG